MRVAEYNAYDDWHFARFYDFSYAGHVEDAEFWLRLARMHGPRLLELGSGTGRLALPLARAGFQVTGLDRSAAMLKLALAKLDRLPTEARSRVRLRQADMCDFDLRRTFNLAFIPLASLFHLHDSEAKRACFRSVHRHLAPGGVLAVDVVAPWRMENQPVAVTGERSGFHPSTGLPVREQNTKLEIDSGAHTVTVRHVYIEGLPGCGETEFSFTQRYTWLTEAELRGLLEEAGFGQVTIFGGYGREEYKADSPRLIALAYA